MGFHFKERWDAYTEILEPLKYSFSCIWRSLGRVRLRDSLKHGFALWYAELETHFARFEEEMTPVPRLVGLASGTVLELGPGTGNQLPRLNADQITRAVGIEPNELLFKILNDKLAELPFLKGIYVPLHAALEDEKALEQHGIVNDSVDTVLCIQVLCSVKYPEEASRIFYRLLKPGGRLIFWEHCASTDWVTRVVQRACNLNWSPLIGHCHLGVDVEAAIFNAGSWEVTESGHDEIKAYNLTPRVWGCLTKQAR